MPQHSETRRLPYTPEQMFDLVADVVRYPEFMPWVSAARVREDRADSMMADLVVGFGGVNERFTSRIRKVRPDRLTVEYVEGPLKFLVNDWIFAPDGPRACLSSFRVDFAFKSRILEAIAARMFDRALRHMIASFEARAERLYGAGASSGSGISNSRAHNAA